MTRVAKQLLRVTVSDFPYVCGWKIGHSELCCRNTEGVTVHCGVGEVVSFLLGCLESHINPNGTYL